MRTTRDYQAVRGTFPMREIKRRPEDDPARFKMQLAPEEDVTDVDDAVDNADTSSLTEGVGSELAAIEH